MEVRTFAVNEVPWLERTQRRARAVARVPVIGPKIAFRLRRVARRRLEYDVNLGLAAAIREFSPHLLLALVSWQDPIRPDILDAAKGAVRVAWLMDDPFLDDETVLPALRTYDRVYAVDGSWLVNLRYWTPSPVAELPCGVDPTAYRPLALPASKSGIAFVGSSYGRLAVGLVRQDLLRPLIGLGLRVYGDPGWRTVPGFEASYAGGPIRTDEANRVYNEAAAVVNVHHTQWRSGTSLRTFAIAAAGGFQVIDWRPGLDRLFSTGEEIVVYRSAEELVGLVAEYLDDVPARERIARAGRERVLREHTYAHRIRRILSDCGLGGGQ